MEVIIEGEGGEGQAPVAPAADASVAMAAGEASAVAAQAAEDAAEAARDAESALDIAGDASESAWDARAAVEEMRAEYAAALDELRGMISSLTIKDVPDDSIPVPERVVNGDGNESQGGEDNAPSGDHDHGSDSKPAKSGRVSYGHPGWFGGS